MYDTPADTTVPDNAGKDATAQVKEEGGGVAALGRAFSILSSIAKSGRGATLTEIARATGLYKSTASRLLGALEYDGYARRLEDGTYAIGPEPLRLAQAYQASFDVQGCIVPILRKLSAESSETLSFYVRQNQYRVVLHRVEPVRGVRVSVKEGERFPIERGAAGKILIAFTEEYDAAYSHFRERFYAVAFGERDPDTTSASAPVFGKGQTLVGALTLSGPRERMAMPGRLHAACILLMTGAAQATDELGGDALPLHMACEKLQREANLP